MEAQFDMQVRYWEQQERNARMNARMDRLTAALQALLPTGSERNVPMRNEGSRPNTVTSSTAQKNSAKGNRNTSNIPKIMQIMGILDHEIVESLVVSLAAPPAPLDDM